jgi:hypothetical protein
LLFKNFVLPFNKTDKELKVPVNIKKRGLTITKNKVEKGRRTYVS